MLTDPDGLALALMFGLAGICWLAVAMVVEAVLSRPMRRRARNRELLARYLRAIDNR